MQNKMRGLQARDFQCGAYKKKKIYRDFHPKDLYFARLVDHTKDTFRALSMTMGPLEKMERERGRVWV